MNERNHAGAFYQIVREIEAVVDPHLCAGVNPGAVIQAFAAVITEIVADMDPAHDQHVRKNLDGLVQKITAEAAREREYRAQRRN